MRESCFTWLDRGVIVRGVVLASMISKLFVVAVTLAQGTPADTAKTRRVELQQADSLLGVVQEGASLRRLIGNVILLQEETWLRADHVTEHGARDDILFVGNVVIIEQGDTLTADRVLYNTRRKVGQATGRVRLSDGEVVVEAPSGRYFVDARHAQFEEGVTLVDSATVLVSEAGEYWSDEKRAEFYGAVRLTADRTVLEADSITYFRTSEISIARGNVFIERLGNDEGTAKVDSTTHTFLFGDWAYNENRTGISRIKGRPLLVQVRADSTGTPTDTLLMRALHLETFRQDSLQRLVAVDSVRIWQRDFAATADSAVYEHIRSSTSVSREESRLFRNPMAWFQQSQVSGDTLRITARDGAADSLFVHSSTFVAQRDSMLNRIQQIRGHSLLGLFDQDSLRMLRVDDNAETIYYLRGEEDQPDGAVRTSADRVVFYLKGDALESIRLFSGVEGAYYAEGLLPQPFQLDGFRWRPTLRPYKFGLLREERILARLRHYTPVGLDALVFPDPEGTDGEVPLPQNDP